MTPVLVLAALGAFLVGGAISFHQQKKPVWSRVALAVLALLSFAYALALWQQGP